MKICIILVCCGTFFFLSAEGLLRVLNYKTKHGEIPKFVTSASIMKRCKVQQYLAPFSMEKREKGLSKTSGLDHIIALETIMRWINEQQVLTEEDRDALLEYLEQQQPHAMTSGEWEERVNEILNFLRAQPGGVPGLADMMLHMAANDSNPVMRMYALQHIAMWIPDEPMKESRRAMVDYLHKLAMTRGDPLAGSAVLFLGDLERAGKLVELDGSLGNRDVGDGHRPPLQLAALRLVADTATAPEVRISALHACVDQGCADALPEARLIAADESLMIPLRKAAIHAIGKFGTAEDISFLESLAESSVDVLAATNPAISQLRKHNPQGHIEN